MVDVLLSRRSLLRSGALAGAALLGGCGRRSPRLLATRGDFPAAWSALLPAPWESQLLEDPGRVVAALRAPAAQRPSLVQLSDGWATSVPLAALEPVGAEALLAAFSPMARAVGRLFAPVGSPVLAFPWSSSPWVLLLRNRPDLAARRDEGWDLLLDPSLRGKVVLPSSPRVVMDLVGGERSRLGRLRAQALAYDDRDGLNLLLAGEAEAAVLPRHRVVPLLRRDPRLQVLLPGSGAPLSWNLLLRPAGSPAAPPLEWLGTALDPPLLTRLLAQGWVPPLPRARLAEAAAGFPPAVAALLVPPEAVLARCRSLPPLPPSERTALQVLWDGAAPPAAARHR